MIGNQRDLYIHEGARGLGAQESNVSLPPQSFTVEAIRL